MSQLKTHQLAYREYERRCIASDLEEAEKMLREFFEDPPDDSEKAMLLHNGISARIRHCKELLLQLDKRVARLSQ